MSSRLVSAIVEFSKQKEFSAPRICLSIASVCKWMLTSRVCDAKRNGYLLQSRFKRSVLFLELFVSLQRYNKLLTRFVVRAQFNDSPFKLLDMFLSPLSNSTLSLPVIGTLPFELYRTQRANASGPCPGGPPSYST